MGKVMKSPANNTVIKTDKEERILCYGFVYLLRFCVWFRLLIGFIFWCTISDKEKNWAVPSGVFCTSHA